jgi:hypothetical protein
MIHIGEHFENFEKGCEIMPPDYLVIDYMKENGLITDEQYQVVTKYTKSGAKELEDRRWIYIQDDIDTDQMQVLKGGPISRDVSSGCGWHSRNVENRNLTRRAGLILAIFPLLAGLLMGASYLWLNKRMRLTEASAPTTLVNTPGCSLEQTKECADKFR